LRLKRLRPTDRLTDRPTRGAAARTVEERRRESRTRGAIARRMSTESKREVLEVALSELRSLRSARAVRGERRRSFVRSFEALEMRRRANRLTDRDSTLVFATQVYEQRGDVYFLSDKKTVTANVKSALAKETASEAAKKR